MEVENKKNIKTKEDFSSLLPLILMVFLIPLFGRLFNIPANTISGVACLLILSFFSTVVVLRTISKVYS